MTVFIFMLIRNEALLLWMNTCTV